MEKKIPTVVTIGGRRYVKANLNKNQENNRMKLKEVMKSLGKRAQKSTLNQCVVEREEEIDFYESPDIKVVFNKSNLPVGFVITGRSEKRGRRDEAPSDLEAAVNELNVNVKKNEE